MGGLSHVDFGMALNGQGAKDVLYANVRKDDIASFIKSSFIKTVMLSTRLSSKNV